MQEIGWVCDGEIAVQLGNKINDFVAEENVPAIADIVPWPQEAIAHFYRQSAYTASRDHEVRERATRRLFSPLRAAATAVCPHCGAPYASPALDELIAFTCPRCGNFVEVEPPKVQ